MSQHGFNEKQEKIHDILLQVCFQTMFPCDAVKEIEAIFKEEENNIPPLTNQLNWN